MSSSISVAAAISVLCPRPPRLLRHPSPAAPCAVPFSRGGRRLTTACAVQRDHRDTVPVSAARPANADESIFMVTLDLSDAPELSTSYTTPGQYVQTSVPSSGLRPAYLEISSAPAPLSGGQQFELLVRAVPGTTAELLCKLGKGDHVELGAAAGPGLPTQLIKQAETVLYFAVAEGLSLIRALIKDGVTNNVTLYYGARNQESVPLQEELKEWKEAGVNVITILPEPVQYPFLRDPEKIIKNPNSTVAVLAGPMEMQQGVKGALTGHGVPRENIITVQGWYPNY